MFGELIGFDASRPDNDTGSGPDVVWKDESAKCGVAFELKTEKDVPAEYNKKEVGQAHNHVQWLKDNEKEIQWDGLLIVGPHGVCKSEASPSHDIYVVEAQVLAARISEFAAKIDDTRGKTVLERWTLLNEVGGLAEWQLTGWFKVLAKTSLKDMRIT
jgi:hypothetical protein